VPTSGVKKPVVEYCVLGGRFFLLNEFLPNFVHHVQHLVSELSRSAQESGQPPTFTPSQHKGPTSSN
jgi:hypothetical protein